MIEFELEDGTTKLVAPEHIEQFMLDFPGAFQVGGDELGNADDFSTETQTMESNVMDSGSDDGSSGSRETSWLAGEEGWIPDQWQGIQRPDVEIKPIQDWGGVKVVKGKGMFAGMEGEYVDDDSRQDLLTQVDNIQHISADNLQTAIGDKWRNKE